MDSAYGVVGRSEFPCRDRQHQVPCSRRIASNSDCVDTADCASRQTLHSANNHSRRALYGLETLSLPKQVPAWNAMGLPATTTSRAGWTAACATIRIRITPNRIILINNGVRPAPGAWPFLFLFQFFQPSFFILHFQLYIVFQVPILTLKYGIPTLKKY